MAPRKAFLIRLDPAVLTALEAWAADDLRSVNGQIEFVLRDSLRRAGRTPKADEPAATELAATPTAAPAETPTAPAETPTAAPRRARR